MHKSHEDCRQAFQSNTEWRVNGTAESSAGSLAVGLPHTLILDQSGETLFARAGAGASRIHLKSQSRAGQDVAPTRIWLHTGTQSIFDKEICSVPAILYLKP